MEINALFIVSMINFAMKNQKKDKDKQTLIFIDNLFGLFGFHTYICQNKHR